MADGGQGPFQSLQSGFVCRVSAFCGLINAPEERLILIFLFEGTLRAGTNPLRLTRVLIQWETDKWDWIIPSFEGYKNLYLDSNVSESAAATNGSVAHQTCPQEGKRQACWIVDSGWHIHINYWLKHLQSKHEHWLHLNNMHIGSDELAKYNHN